MNKQIIHCDMNNYFASIEMLSNPYLENIAFAVCGDTKLRHGIILAKNEIAKKSGIVTGESLYSAKKKCKNLVVCNADYQKYLRYTKLSREIYNRYSDYIYPYGMDEAWIDITDKCQNTNDAIMIAREIKRTIKNELGLNIAIGLSFNFIFSKLGSDQKSDDVYVITKDDYINKTRYMPAFNLLFVGAKTRSVLKRLNILTIGDLRETEPLLLKGYLGKKGLTLYKFANGDDSEFNPVTEKDDDIKSLSNTITSPKDIISLDEAKAFIYILSSVINKRLERHNLEGKTIQVNIKFNDFSVYNKQKSIDNYISSLKSIYELALLILDKCEIKLPIRSITLRISNVRICTNIQLSLFDDNANDSEIDRLIDELRNRYGNIYIEKTSTSKDWED